MTKLKSRQVVTKSKQKKIQQYARALDRDLRKLIQSIGNIPQTSLRLRSGLLRQTVKDTRRGSRGRR